LLACPGRPVVTVNGQALSRWTFDYNNVLAWQDEAGCSAWLQLLVLPGGPVLVGKVLAGGNYEGMTPPRMHPPSSWLPWIVCATASLTLHAQLPALLRRPCAASRRVMAANSARMWACMPGWCPAFRHC
jgi:hypothetical protein